MAARSRGNGTNFDWLRKSCYISTCDLSPDGNPEKYRRPMKSAIRVDEVLMVRKRSSPRKHKKHYYQADKMQIMTMIIERL